MIKQSTQQLIFLNYSVWLENVGQLTNINYFLTAKNFLQQNLMTFAVFSLCPASSVLLSVARKIKAESDSATTICEQVINFCMVDQVF